MTRFSRGYTLLETVIALAIIGLITVTIAAGSGRNITSQRFSDEVRQFANNLKAAKTQSYTTQTGSCGTGLVCYWRGTELEMDNSTSATNYKYNYLNSSTDYQLNGDSQNGGSFIETLVTTYTLNNLQIQSITYNDGTQTYSGTTQVPSIAVAYLAPDGKMATSKNKIAGTFPDQDSTITIKLKTPGATNLTGTVIITAADGTISTSIN